MIPALFLIPLVALFRIFLAWQPVGSSLHPSWMVGFTPLAGVAVCAGMFLPRRLALVIPLGILLLSDTIIDAHYGPAFHFFSVATFANNTLVWAGAREYPQSAAGWWQALTVGLPGYLPSYVFFRNGLVSDALYSMVFVACVRLTRPAQEAHRSPLQAVGLGG